jgi:hypothetical protein
LERIEPAPMLPSSMEISAGSSATRNRRLVQAASSSAACAIALAVLAWAEPAQASPGLEGTRNLAMGNSARASAYGPNAAIASSATVSFSQQFAIEPAYQFAIHDRTHGLSINVVDSLLNPRLAIGLGYTFLRGNPRVQYLDAAEDQQELDLEHFGHEAALFISVAAVKNWLAIAVKPKYQYTSLRFLDDEGVARNATDKLNAFGLDASIAINFADWARVSVIGYNLVGAKDPSYTDDDPLTLEGVGMAEDPMIDPDDPPFDGAPLNVSNVRRVSDYPRSLAHGLAVFPLRNPNFSLNFDGTYDFSSYWNQDKFVRYTLGGSAEFVAGPVPIRAGSYFDSRGREKGDNRAFVTAGLGFIHVPRKGGAGVDVGLAFSRQVAGPNPETFIGLSVGVRLHPDL